MSPSARASWPWCANPPHPHAWGAGALSRRLGLSRAPLADRLSSHRFWANQFRLLPHAAAYWLLDTLRRWLVQAGTPHLQWGGILGRARPCNCVGCIITLARATAAARCAHRATEGTRQRRDGASCACLCPLVA